VLDALVREGVELRGHAEAIAIEPEGAGARASYRCDERHEDFVATHVLVAGRRAPNVHNIGLEQAKVAFDRHGIEVRKNFRTSNRKVHAIGDVIGGEMSAQSAQHQAGLLLRHLLFRLPAAAGPGSVARALQTDPGIAVAGLTENEARAKDPRARIYRLPLAEIEAAHTGLPVAGHVKVMVARDERVLGAAIVGPRADELIAPWQLAAAKRLRIDDMAATAVPTMSLAEVSRRAALQHFSAKFRSPLLQSLARFLRRFG